MKRIFKVASHLRLKLAQEDASERVRAAILKTKEMIPGHWDTCLSNRAGKSAHLGSFYPNVGTNDLERMLLDTTWRPFSHPDIMGPATGFVTDIGGAFGMIPIDDLPPEATLSVIPSAKEPGKVELAFPNNDTPATDHTVILLGPAGREDPTEIVWTFFPGDPVLPTTLDSSVLNEDETDSISKERAKEVGFQWVKSE